MVGEAPSALWGCTKAQTHQNWEVLQIKHPAKGLQGRGGEVQQPKNPPSRGGRCRSSRVGFCGRKGAGEQRNNEVLQGPECSASPQELWDKQDWFLNQEWFKGSCDLWGCSRKRENAPCSPQGSKARAGSCIPPNPWTTPDAPGTDFGTR